MKRAACARYLVPTLVISCVLSIAAPCRAQGVDTPAPNGARDDGDSVLVPAGFLGLVAPVTNRIAVNAYGFYYGEVKAPVAQVDVPIRITRFLAVTPSYLYYAVPPSGLNKASMYPVSIPDTFEENQFRIDGTFKFAIRKLEISDRNMYVRRFRPTDEINRYRQRIAVAHPLVVGGHTWKPFASYEGFYERKNGGWNRDRVMAGVTLPLEKHVSLQPSYVWDHNRVRGLRDMNYLQLGIIVSTR